MEIKTYIASFRKRAQFLLTIVIAPLAITLLADIVIQLSKGNSIPLWQYIFTGLCVFIFFLLLVSGYSNKLDNLVTIINKRERIKRLHKPKILILDGTIGEGHETPPRPEFTDFRPIDWKHNLESVTDWKIVVGSFACLKNSHDFQIVLNPFGEVYSENDSRNFSVFKTICDYVYSGGIFVNVAGIPFWYYHDTQDPLFINKRATAGVLSKELHDTGERIVLRPLFVSKFPQISDLSDSLPVECIQSDDERKQFDEIAGAGGNNRAIMFRAYQPQTPGAIPLLRCNNPEKWLIISLKYGDGYFLLSGLDLKGANNTGIKKVTAAIKGWINYETRQ